MINLRSTPQITQQIRLKLLEHHREALTINILKVFLGAEML